MFTQRIEIGFITLLLLLAIGSGIYFFSDSPMPPAGENIEEPVAVIPSIENGEPSKEEPKAPAYPRLDRSVAIPDSFGKEGKAEILKLFATALAALETTPTDIDHWLALGILRNQINDFEGAKEHWEYVITAFPKNPIAYGNLASLYAFDLKDPVKAETMFKKALEVGPDQVHTYRNFAEFYLYVLKDIEKTKAVLKTGIEKTGTNSGPLQTMLQSIEQMK